MAIILEGTNFEDAIVGSLQVNKLVYESNKPDAIIINIRGTKGGISIGDNLSYVNGTTSFSGKIYYIYQGSTSFNLYVRHPNPAPLAGKTGGTVTNGTVVTASAPAYESAATLQNAGEQAEALIADVDPPVAGGEPANIVSKLPAPLQNKKMLTIGGIALLAVAAFIVLKGKGKGKGKK